MRFLVSLLVVALLAGCSTPAEDSQALPRTETFALSVGDGGTVTQNFEVEAIAAQVTVEFVATSAPEGWTAKLRAPSGSEAECERPSEANATGSDACRLNMPAQPGTWTLSLASDGATRADATVTLS